MKILQVMAGNDHGGAETAFVDMCIALRDAGMEVVYGGLRQTPESIASIALQEDVDVVGLSMHNGAHTTLAPLVVKALRDEGLDTAVVVGGIVPAADVPYLVEAGVSEVLGPGASRDEVVEAVTRAAARTAEHAD